MKVKNDRLYVIKSYGMPRTDLINIQNNNLDCDPFIVFSVFGDKDKNK